MVFSIEYINIPTLIAIIVIAYLMDDVFLFMKLGNDTTKQLMATAVGCIIAVRKFGSLRFEPFANRFGEENPLYAMGFMREKSQKSKWATYQRGIFFWQAVTLVLAIMSKIAFILSQRLVFSDFEIVAVYMCSFLRISCVSFVVILVGYVVTWSYYMVTYHRSFRYYAGRDKVWKPFSFVGQDHYYVWPNEQKILPWTCASIYPYEEDDYVKENIKKSCVADGYEKEREFDFSDQGNAVFYKKEEASEVHILSVIETENLKDEHTKQLNDFFGEFWKENIGKEEKKQPIYFTFVIFCRRTNSLLAKQILEEANGLLMYRNRYRLGAIFSEKEYKLNIKQVSPKSHYKDIYRKMSGELRRFAGGDTEI